MEIYLHFLTPETAKVTTTVLQGPVWMVQVSIRATVTKQVIIDLTEKQLEQLHHECAVALRELDAQKTPVLAPGEDPHPSSPGREISRSS